MNLLIKIPTVLFLVGISFANNLEADAVETVRKQKEAYDKQEKLKNEAKDNFERFLNKKFIVDQWKDKIEYNPDTGRLIFKGDVDIPEDTEKNLVIGTGDNPYLDPSDRIYIFISSSIPKSTLIEYAKQIIDLNLENRAVMVLRGCIGGCRYIKPTLRWISSILHEEGKNKEGLPVRIWIDPLLFRMYKINKVPCVVFAENVYLNQIYLSEGLGYNLKNNPKAVVSCGDWSLKYHLEKLYEKTKNKKLEKLVKHTGG